MFRSLLVVRANLTGRFVACDTNGMHEPSRDANGREALRDGACDMEMLRPSAYDRSAVEMERRCEMKSAAGRQICDPKIERERLHESHPTKSKTILRKPRQRGQDGQDGRDRRDGQDPIARRK
jgi:hypothetical protein